MGEGRFAGPPPFHFDDCGSAVFVDEWLQVRNKLSIEIFSRDPSIEIAPSSAP